MINNAFKQISIPNKKYTIEDLTTDFLPKLFEDEQRKAQNLNTVRPYKIMISAPSNTWLYFNNDISPVVINETGKFIWDLSSFGTFNSLYFVFNDSKYLWDSDNAVWVENQEGLSIETIWKDLTGYDINAITSHSNNIIIAIFSAVLLTRINELEDATIDAVLANNITNLQNLFQSNRLQKRNINKYIDIFY